ncbi:type II secretion system F family protein [Cellulomonas sp. PhB150]|uniref:type II secretion system F family protein n=1 Tax=Cellulomonas sp. PhB150 TaxID=2485188 RepID=UPI000F47ADD1|nr:type II secretion system F family protein [Cellulomonas sp. PhB150]ROS30727.1 type II secretion system (T2SS) protein F [Cellulomonas sp. PhB150]
MIPLSTLAIIALGAIVGAGILLLVVALMGTEPKPPSVRRGGGGSLLRARKRIVIAAVVGLVTLVVTQWPVAAVGAALFSLAAPALLGGAKAEREQTARLEGLASWTESLRDTIAGAVGLEQAIPATVYAAAPAIQPQLRLLVDRLRVRVPLATALRGLADDLDDPSADLVVAALVLNAKLRGPGLRQVLTSLSDAARAELEMRQRVTAGRSSTRRSAQIVTVFSLAIMTGITLANPEFVEPYDSAQGQVVLLVIAALFAAGFWWMKRLSGVDMPARFLVEEDAR